MSSLLPPAAVLDGPALAAGADAEGEADSADAAGAAGAAASALEKNASGTGLVPRA
jgi:hypothetical protein